MKSTIYIFLLLLLLLPFLSLGQEGINNNVDNEKFNSSNSTGLSNLTKLEKYILENKGKEAYLLHKGREEYKNQNYQKAIKIWEKVLYINSKNINAKKYINRAKYKLKILKNPGYYNNYRYYIINHFGIQFYFEHIKLSESIKGGSFFCMEPYLIINKYISARLKYSTEFFNDYFDSNLFGGSIQINSFLLNRIGINLNHYKDNLEDLLYNPYIGIGYLRNIKNTSNADYIIFKLCLLKVDKYFIAEDFYAFNYKFSISLLPISMYYNLNIKDISLSFEVLSLGLLF